jgi:hypothetical protein
VMNSLRLTGLIPKQGSRTRYSRSSPCIAAKAAGLSPVRVSSCRCGPRARASGAPNNRRLSEVRDYRSFVPLRTHAVKWTSSGNRTDASTMHRATDSVWLVTYPQQLTPS